MTILACFPAMTNIGDIVSMLGWAVVGVGAICIVEHFIFPKIGLTRFWAMYKEKKINWAAIITWAVSIIFVVVMKQTGILHRNFIFIPEWIISAVLYTALASLMGARGDYSKEEAEEEQFQKELKELVDEEADKEMEHIEKTEKGSALPNLLSVIAYVLLAAMVICSIVTYMGAVTIAAYKTIAIILTLLYFVLNGSSTFIKYRREAAVLH